MIWTNSVSWQRAQEQANIGLWQQKSTLTSS